MKQWVKEFLKWCDDNGIQNVPKTEKELLELKTLELNGLGLTEVTEHIVNLKSLSFLNLSDNYLKDLPILPPYIFRLNINNNLFQQIPSSLQKLHLGLLEAENNMIEELPDWYSKSEILIGLILDNNKISSIEPLRGCKNVTTLLVAENKISDISPIYEMPKLKIFDCSENPIKKIEKGIRKCKRLKNFCMMGTNIEDFDLGIFLIDCKLSLTTKDSFKLRVGNMIMKYPILKYIARKLLLRGEYA